MSTTATSEHTPAGETMVTFRSRLRDGYVFCWPGELTVYAIDTRTGEQWCKRDDKVMAYDWSDEGFESLMTDWLDAGIRRT